jgi:DNA-binding SARP family transcriptional activator
LLAANRVVTRPRLIEAIWDDQAPPTAERQLKNLISALRRSLTEAGGTEQIVFESSGYRIVVDESHLDTHAFAARVAQAQVLQSSGQVTAAAQHLRAALTLWRGPALDGCKTRDVMAAAARLDELHMTTIEQCLDLELRIGRHRDLVGELTELVAVHSTRERLVGHLMLALHRSDRQADALQVYRRVQTRLAAELGCDPGRALQDLHTAILRNDPHTLEPARQSTDETATGSPQPDMAGAAPGDNLALTGHSSQEPGSATAVRVATVADSIVEERTADDVAPSLRDTRQDCSDRPRSGAWRRPVRIVRTSRHRPVVAAVSTALVLALAATAYVLPRVFDVDTASGDAAPDTAVVDPGPASGTPPPTVTSTSTSPKQRPGVYAQPPVLTIGVNPQREILARGGSTAYVFDSPVNALKPLPADYRNPQILANWAYDNGGGDSNTTHVDVTIKAPDTRLVQLTDLTIKLVERKAPPAGVEVVVKNLQFAPGTNVRHASVNLDRPAPTVEMTGGLAKPQGEQDEFAYHVTPTEPEIVRIRATTSKFNCTWFAELHFTIGDTSGTIIIDNNGRPFRTTASKSSTPYYAQPDGSLQPASPR